MVGVHEKHDPQLLLWRRPANNWVSNGYRHLRANHKVTNKIPFEFCILNDLNKML